MTAPNGKRNNMLAREKRKLAIIQCIKGCNGISRADISRAMNIGRKAIAPILRELKEAQKIHVGSWMASGGVTFALWVYGRGFDADKNIVRGSVHPSKKAKELANLASKEAMSEVVKRRHEMWSKTFVPKLDPAAAWMTNPIGG